MDNNTPQSGSIEMPSINSIQDLPKIEMPSVDEVQTAGTSANQIPAQSVGQTQPAPATGAVPPTQPVQTPYNYAPVQNVNSVPSVNPYAAAVQPLVRNKRTAGQIICMVIGIIFTVFFGFLFLVFLLADVFTGFEDISTTIFIHIFLAIFLGIGILLIVLGSKKVKNTVVSVPAPQQTYAPQYAAPVQTAAPVQAATPVQAANTGTVSTAQQTPVVSNTGTTPAAYNYAPTTMLIDDSKEVAQKNARNSALLSIGIVVIMWIILIAVALFLNRWIFSWYFLIIPVIVSIGAIKNYPKSLSAWISLILSILSIVLFVFVSVQLSPYFT